MFIAQRTNNMRIIVFISFCLFLLSSCVVIGLTNDYGKLNRERRQLINPLVNFDKTKPGNIYIVNAAQIKENIINYPKAIVYVFSVGCSHHEDVPLSVFENFAERNKFRLYLVLTGYSELEKVLDQEINSPLYSIDNKYYKTRLRHLYERYFTNELTGKPLKAKYSEREHFGSIYFFENGQLVKVLNELPE